MKNPSGHRVSIAVLLAIAVMFRSRISGAPSKQKDMTETPIAKTHTQDISGVAQDESLKGVDFDLPTAKVEDHSIYDKILKEKSSQINAEAVSRLNQSYYDLYRAGCHSIEGDVDIRTIGYLVQKDGIRHMSNRRTLRRFLFQQGGSSRLETQKNSEKDPNTVIDKDIEKICGGAIDQWLGMATNPLINVPKGTAADIHRNSNGYSVTLPDECGGCIVELNKSNLVTRIAMENGKVNVRPTFESTAQGLVIKKFIVKMEDMPEWEIWIHNIYIGGFWLPDTIKVHIENEKSRTDMEIQLSNYQVNGIVL